MYVSSARLHFDTDKVSITTDMVTNTHMVRVFTHYTDSVHIFLYWPPRNVPGDCPDNNIQHSAKIWNQSFFGADAFYAKVWKQPDKRHQGHITSKNNFTLLTHLWISSARFIWSLQSLHMTSGPLPLSSSFAFSIHYLSSYHALTHILTQLSINNTSSHLQPINTTDCCNLTWVGAQVLLLLRFSSTTREQLNGQSTQDQPAVVT